MPPDESPRTDIYAVRLALSFSSWVNRRVEHFNFIDGRTVRRQVSVDFTLPEEPGFEEVREVMVPIMVLRKEVMRGIDVTDADGCSLSVVESAQARDITVGGLVGISERFPRLRTPLPRATLERILKADRDQGQDLAEEAVARQGAIGEALSSVQRGQRERLTALIGELGEGFMLLVSIPYAPGKSGLIKVSYEARLETSFRQSVRELGLGGGAYFLLSRFFSSFGLVGRAEYFTEIPLRLGRSYHAEVMPAPGTYAEEASLTLEKSTQSPAGGSDSKEEAEEPTKNVHRDFNHSRPHLLDNADGGKTDRSEQGFLEVILHAEREGLIFPLFFSAGVIAGVLAFVSKQAGHDRLDGITLGALLLAPVALAAYYARSDENGYLTTAMRGVRYVGTTAVFAGVVVIGLLALGYVQPHGEGASDPDALVIVRCAARVSLACTVALALALVAPFADELARRVLVSPKSRRKDPKVTFRDLVLLLLPPVVLIAAGVWAFLELMHLLPI